MKRILLIVTLLVAAMQISAANVDLTMAKLPVHR